MQSYFLGTQLRERQARVRVILNATKTDQVLLKGCKYVKRERKKDQFHFEILKRGALTCIFKKEWLKKESKAVSDFRSAITFLALTSG